MYRMEVHLMSLIRWRPRRNFDHWDSFGNEISNLRHEMDSLLSHFMPTGYGIEFGDSMFPSAELQNNDDTLILRLEVPGLQPEDIDIQLKADSVSIKGERRSTERIEEDNMTRSEFHYGSFSRTIALPHAVKIDEVVANYKDGILNLTMPKQEGTPHKSVKVELKPSE